MDKVMTSKSSHATSESLHVQLQLLIIAFCRGCNDFLICTTRNSLARLRKEAHMLDCRYARFRSLESNMANCSTELRRAGKFECMYLCFYPHSVLFLLKLSLGNKCREAHGVQERRNASNFLLVKRFGSIEAQ